MLKDNVKKKKKNYHIALELLINYFYFWKITIKMVLNNRKWINDSI